MPAEVVHIEDRKRIWLEYPCEHFWKRGAKRPREDSLTDPRAEGRRLIAPNEMQKATAIRRERAVDHTAERRIIGRSHVLEHADGDEGIAGSLHMAVIVLNELDVIAQSFSGCPLAGVCDLLR